MKLKLVIASSNPGKIREFRDALRRLDIDLLSAADVGLGPFPEETGASYEENALMKAGFAALGSGLPALADDSGIEVDALDGAPGIYSARFGGPMTDGERLAHLLQKIRKVPRGARSASFVCTVVLATPGGEVVTFTGECRGEILQGPHGEGGFGYDPIFYSPELGKSFAQANTEEKARVSHRGRALRNFLTWALTPTAKHTMAERTPRHRSER
jgi:XTP/dITP diphosphohydrolase